jgi:hypothetical protein
MKALVFAALAALSLGVGLVAQAAKAATDTLVVGGAVKTPLTLTVADLATMPRTTVTVTENGTDVHYDGVLLADILKRAGAPSGAALQRQPHHCRGHTGRQAALGVSGPVPDHGTA